MFLIFPAWHSVSDGGDNLELVVPDSYDDLEI